MSKLMSRTKGPVPPVILATAILCQYGLHHWLPVARIVDEPWTRAGFVLGALGLLAVIGPVAAFFRAKTTILPFHDSSALVVTGIYRFTRNPMYVGMVMVLLGVATWLGNLGPFIMPLLFVPIMNTRVIKHEEKMLEEQFGQEYRDMMNSVRRWL